jgi:hypothetical protein
MGLLIGGLWCGSPLQAQQDLHPEAQAESLECVVASVRIHYFWDKEERKAWKIVAGRPVQYFAKKGDDSESFSWTLTHVGANHTYQLQPIEPATLGRQGTLEIENLWNENKYFGPVNVALDNGVGGKDVQDGSIYFVKNASNPLTGNPNWFEFWQDNTIVRALLQSIPNQQVFNTQTCKFEAEPGIAKAYLKYETFLFQKNGECEPIYVHQSVGKGTPFCQDLYNEPTRVNIRPTEYQIRMGSNTSKSKHAWNRDPSTLIEGVHAFYSTLVHEIEHANIYYESWKNGFDESKDRDEDNYRDDWESLANLEMKNSSFHPKPFIRFNGVKDDDNENVEITLLNDSHQENYITHLLFQNPAWYSAGTEYEEWRCLKKEYELYHQLDIINPYDWSYDPTKKPHTIQGKQW